MDSSCIRKFIFVAVILANSALPANAQNFGIQVAAHKNQDESVALKYAIERAGYSAYIRNENSYYKLRVGPYHSRETAEQEQSALRHFLIARFGATEYEETWIASESPGESLSNKDVSPVKKRVAVIEVKPVLRTANASSGKNVVVEALEFLGTPYRWGGNGDPGFDCSGFTSYVYAVSGHPIPRTARGQYLIGEKIEKDVLVDGDLVFFTTYAPGASHVGIYVGANQFIHASSGSGEVIRTDLGNSYYQKRYLGARRIFSKGHDASTRLSLLFPEIPYRN
ncbi:MAG: C40 family peptidase [Candidatus Lindowbacteria bacterium]|nr:C40 family peptidase [Candidatus Lindowbacteria bacterium]